MNKAQAKICALFLDACYKKARLDGHVVDVAVLIAQAMDTDGKRRILGIMIG